MSHKENIQMRDARDRMSELLALGQPFPLRDLPVPVEGLTVPFNGVALIPIEYSQLGVLYQLHDPRETLVSRPSDSGDVPVQLEGTGDIIYLESPPIQDDISYKVLAINTGSNNKAYLHTLATVKVGLDITLSGHISNQSLLDANNDQFNDTDPRLCIYGDTLEITMPNSQEGVDYKLVHFVSTGQQINEVVVSTSPVRGTGGQIVLASSAVYEDTIIRIRATKIFDAEEGREDQTDLLAIEMPIKVKASREPATTVSIQIVGYNQQSAVHITDTQNTAQYRIHAHRILDPEIIHEPASDSVVLRVNIPNEPEVQVRRPNVLPEPWLPVNDYIPITDYHPGTGGELIIPIADLTEDCILIVETMKSHKVTDNLTIPSYVWLPEPMLILVRPDPAPELTLVIPMNGGQSDGLMRVVSGQPGVFYHFRTAPDSGDLPQPAYIHKRDDNSDVVNKGLDQLEVGIDFVIAPDSTISEIEAEPDHDKRHPAVPVLESELLVVGTTLYIRAVKAQTGIEENLHESVQIIAAPDITLVNPGVNSGEVASISILASRTGESYELYANDELLQPAIAGTGADLAIDTNVVTSDSEYYLRVYKSDATEVTVEQIEHITVLLNPDNTLSVSAIATDIAHNTETYIAIQSSQIDAQYQLVVNGSLVGQAINGTGSELQLPTGLLTDDTVFTVRANRQINADVFVDLVQTATVTVQAAPA